MSIVKTYCSILVLFFIPIQLLSQTLIKAFDEKISDGYVKVSTFATGNVKALATGESKDNIATNGALGINMVIGKMSLTSIINVASTLDTLDDIFSNILLNPSNGSGLRAGLLDLRLAKIYRHFALHCYASISTSNWRKDTLANDVTVGGIGVLIQRQLIASKEENVVSLGLEIGLSTRVLLGELSSNEQLRLYYLNSKNKIFGGLEAGMTISINNLVASLQFYYFIGNKIKGLTDGQLTTGISMKTNLFSFTSKLND